MSDVFDFLPYWVRGNENIRIMLFIDGENLAIRYKHILEDKSPVSHIDYKPDIYVWSQRINNMLTNANIIRKYYYTCVKGDLDCINGICDCLKKVGIEAPRVFKKTKDKGSKQVDITLTTDMLTHAFRKNYDIAILIAGDEDYLPLVKAVQAEGHRVFVWFFESATNHELKMAADKFNDIQKILFTDQ